MVNEIFVNGLLVIKLQRVKVGRTWKDELVLQENKTKFVCDLINDDIMYKCTDCGILSTRGYLRELFTIKPYLCKSCSTSGTRSGMFGKHHSQSMKDNLSRDRKGKGIGSDNPMYGKSVMDVWIKKYGIEIANEMWSKKSAKHSVSMLGDMNPFYGRSHTTESIGKIKAGVTKWHENMSDDEYNEIRDKMSKGQHNAIQTDTVYYSSIKSKAAYESHKSQFNDYELNKIEKKVRDYLYELEEIFDTSVILGYNQYDFGLKEKRILIEVDGDYWHGNPVLYNDDGSDGKRKLNNIQRDKIKRDFEKTKWAIDHEYKLIRIWESEINDESYKEKLKKLL